MPLVSKQISGQLEGAIRRACMRSGGRAWYGWKARVLKCLEPRDRSLPPRFGPVIRALLSGAGALSPWDFARRAYVFTFLGARAEGSQMDEDEMEGCGASAGSETASTSKSHLLYMSTGPRIKGVPS